jgi:hypothetical protein
MATTPNDALAEIKRLYYSATRSSIHRDLARAVQLLKTMADEDDRQRAAVYMDGLSQMRSEWGGANVKSDHHEGHEGPRRKDRRG